jgi:thiamine biosynthesis lipoprotein
MDPVSASIRRARPLLGTFVEISLADASHPDAEAAVEAAFAAVAKVHGLMSFHAPGSDVSRLNRGARARPLVVDPWTFEVLQAALDLSARSARAFDIAVAPLLQDLGLLPPDERPAATRSAAASAHIELLAGRRVRFHHPDLRIDLGGIAKGFAVDRAVDALRACDVRAGLVNAGGDLVAFGPRPHTVHVRDPRDPRRLLCALEVHEEALATSACRDPLRPDATAAAIVDPRTGERASAIIGATVRAPSCMLADALTKVVMVAPTDALALLDHFHANALIVLADGAVRVTDDWRDASGAFSGKAGTGFPQKIRQINNPECFPMHLKRKAL